MQVRRGRLRVRVRSHATTWNYDTIARRVRPHIVIIGGGFGGLDAARGFAGAPLRVTLLDRHNYHLFQPLLYQVATASLSPGDIASPIRWVLRRQENVQVLLAEARAVEPSARRVVLDSGPDQTGSGPAKDGHDVPGPRAGHPVQALSYK